jgi:ABC-type branched-subunit amino acid transport system substrate-binding protein
MKPMPIRSISTSSKSGSILPTAWSMRDGLGDKAGKMIVATQSYETTDPTVDSQIVALQGSGADVLLTAAIPKFAAQAIRKVYDIGWKPTHFLNSVANSVGTVMKPAGSTRALTSFQRPSLKPPPIRSGRVHPSTKNGWLS